MDEETAAQQCMYDLTEEIDKYRREQEQLDFKLELCYRKKIELLREFPTLKFRRPDESFTR